MRKKPKISTKDLDTFRDAMEGVKTYTHKKVTLQHKHTPTRRKKTPSVEDQEETAFIFRDVSNVQPVAGSDDITYTTSGIDQRTFKRLRKGTLTIDAVLDLHGMTVEEARIALDRFLRLAIADEMRVILIIHGKGHRSQTPILKNKINYWLRELNMVLAFCSAIPADGGKGATYVLLKRMREEDDT